LTVREIKDTASSDFTDYKDRNKYLFKGKKLIKVLVCALIAVSSLRISMTKFGICGGNVVFWRLKRNVPGKGERCGNRVFGKRVVFVYIEPEAFP